MEEITRTKRIEVAHYYLTGCTYKEIERETGVSHGSVANIVREIENSDLTIPGLPSDQINDLRQLSSDLKKSGLKSSQALMGIAFFKRLRDLEIALEQLDVWSELTKKLTPQDFPADEFFKAASRLHELETSQGIPFDILVEEYKRRQEETEKLKVEIEVLNKTKLGLSDEIKHLSSQTEGLKREKEKLENDTQMQSTRIRELRSTMEASEKEKSGLAAS